MIIFLILVYPWLAILLVFPAVLTGISDWLVVEREASSEEQNRKKLVTSVKNRIVRQLAQLESQIHATSQSSHGSLNENRKALRHILKYSINYVDRQARYVHPNIFEIQDRLDKKDNPIKRLQKKVDGLQRCVDSLGDIAKVFINQFKEQQNAYGGGGGGSRNSGSYGGGGAGRSSSSGGGGGSSPGSPDDGSGWVHILPGVCVYVCVYVCVSHGKDIVEGTKNKKKRRKRNINTV